MTIVFLLNVNRHTALLNAVFWVTNCNGERQRPVGAAQAHQPPTVTVHRERIPTLRDSHLHSFVSTAL